MDCFSWDETTPPQICVKEYLFSLSFPWNWKMRKKVLYLKRSYKKPYIHSFTTIVHIKPQVYTNNEVTTIQFYFNLEDTDDLNECPATKATQRIQYILFTNIFMEHTYTLNKGCRIATFSILTPEQVKYTKPISPEPLYPLPDTSHIDAIQQVDALPKMPNCKQSNNTYWFLCPQESGDEDQQTTLEKLILQKV